MCWRCVTSVWTSRGERRECVFQTWELFWTIILVKSRAQFIRLSLLQFLAPQYLSSRFHLLLPCSALPYGFPFLPFFPFLSLPLSLSLYLTELNLNQLRNISVGVAFWTSLSQQRHYSQRCVCPKPAPFATPLARALHLPLKVFCVRYVCISHICIQIFLLCVSELLFEWTVVKMCVRVYHFLFANHEPVA